MILKTLVLMVGAVPALAQGNAGPYQCVVHASDPAHLRSEGFTELIGDIVLSCAGGSPTAVGQPIPQANITVFLNSNITSRILSNTGSEALLLLDEPGTPANPLQQLCGSLNGCAVTGNGGIGEPFSGTDANHSNIFQGMVSGNSVTFFGVPIDPPGATRIRNYRIVNIRTDATSVSLTNFGQVTAYIASSPSATSLPLDKSQVLVGFVSSGLSYGGGIFTIPGCTGIDDTNRFTVVSFSEPPLFTTSFKPRTPAGPIVTSLQNTPGLVSRNSESGFGFAGLPAAGLADAGTRFRVSWQNIPAGVSLWVSPSNFGASPKSMAVLIPSETGAFSPIAGSTTMLGIDVIQVPVNNGVATAIWEVTASDPFAIDSFTFGVILNTATSGPLDVNIAPMTARGSFAPAPPAFSLANAATAQAFPIPVPRFADTSLPANMLTVTPCVTNILFPFITAQSGFDTGLAISNTSKDPFGTTPQTGPCTLNFYGPNPPQPFITQAIAGGSTYTTVMSNVAPSFQGYVIAVCKFQFAHGLAFITDFGANKVAESYLGLILGNAPIRRVTQGGPSEVLSK